MIDKIIIIGNPELENCDLTELKEKITVFHNFIISSVSSVIGTKKIYNRKLIKVMSSGEEVFTVSLVMNKPRISDLQLNYSLKDLYGNILVSSSQEYPAIDELLLDLNFIKDNIEMIKENNVDV